MKKNNYQAQPEGRSQPEIRLGDIWQDGHGSKITIKGTTFNRVDYIRHGYDHPCVCSSDRLRREFSFVSSLVAESDCTSRIMAATSSRDRVLVMRKIIREKGAAQ